MIFTSLQNENVLGGSYHLKNLFKITVYFFIISFKLVFCEKRIDSQHLWIVKQDNNEGNKPLKAISIPFRNALSKPKMAT